MHLRFSMYGCDEIKHPQKVMEDLGITYKDATPQSIADQWWFWDCENVPAELPKYLTPLELDPKIQAIYYNPSPSPQ